MEKRENARHALRHHKETTVESIVEAMRLVRNLVDLGES